jgi:hypothetical protein
VFLLQTFEISQTHQGSEGLSSPRRQELGLEIADLVAYVTAFVTLVELEYKVFRWSLHRHFSPKPFPICAVADRWGKLFLV